MRTLRTIRFEIWVALLCILLSGASVWFYYAAKYVQLYSLFLISFAGLIAAYFLQHRQQLLSLLFICIPFSIGVKVFAESEIQLPTEPLIGMLMLMLIGTSGGWKALKKDLFSNPVSLLISIELLWLVICSFFSELSTVSFKYTLVRSCYVGVFFFLALQWLRASDKPERLFMLYSIGLIIPIIRGMIFHSHFGFSHQTAYQMPQPFFNDHTIYGACIAFVIPMLFFITTAPRIFQRSYFRSLLLILLLLFFLTAEFLSYSRAGWLSLALAFGLGILLRMRIRAWLVALLLVIAGSTLYFAADLVFAQVEDKTAVSSKGDIEDHVKSITNIETDASNKERINRWKCAIRMGKEHPFFGFGPRTYKFFYGNYQIREDMTYTSTFRGNKGHSHSEYLSWFAEEGYVGFLIHAGLFLATLLFGVDVVRRCVDRRNRLVASGALLGFFTYFVHGFFNGFMEEDKMASLVFMSMAVLVYLYEKEKQSQHAASE